MQHNGNKSILKITAVTVVIIFAMLLMVYPLRGDGDPAVHHGGSRTGGGPGIVLSSVPNNLLVLSTFAVNMLIFPDRDRRIFLSSVAIKRHARGGPQTAYYSMCTAGLPRGRRPIGLTIAGAIFCPHFTRLPYFHYGCTGRDRHGAAVAVAVTPGFRAGWLWRNRFELLEPNAS